MHIYRMIISSEATEDLGEMAAYIATLYRPESGHKYVNRILGKLASLTYTADIYQYTHYSNARRINPFAKTISIMNGKWTVVFHIDNDFVVVDRFLPSKVMVL